MCCLPGLHVGGIIACAELPLSFHSFYAQFDTFVRQLNIYGFKKIGRTPRGKEKKPLIFQHSEGLFRRGQEVLLQQIERKHANANSVAYAGHYQAKVEYVAPGEQDPSMLDDDRRWKQMQQQVAVSVDDESLNDAATTLIV